MCQRRFNDVPVLSRGRHGPPSIVERVRSVVRGFNFTFASPIELLRSALSVFRRE